MNNISLRRFSEKDIPLKVRWINDPRNNVYLHYDLPLREDATRIWFARVRDDKQRYDCTILCDDIPIGIIGLLKVDTRNKSAELYITIGEVVCKGKGVAGQAMKELLQIAFFEMDIERVYLFVEEENESAVHAYEKFGFVKEGRLRKEIVNQTGTRVNRLIYAMLKEEFEERYVQR